MTTFKHMNPMYVPSSQWPGKHLHFQVLQHAFVLINVFTFRGPDKWSKCRNSRA